MAVRIDAASRDVKLLNLAYDPSLPPTTLAAMERVGRRMGLPLETLELLGQDLAVCEAFLAAADRGEAAAFLGVLDRDGLEAALRRRAGVAAEPAAPPLLLHT